MEEVGHQLAEVDAGVEAFADGVGAVGVRHHAELLAVGDEGVHQRFSSLIVAVVVAGAVDEQQLALKLVGEGQRRALAVALGIVRGQAHVALLINGVVQAHIGNRRDGYARGVEVGMTEQGVKGHGSAAAPSPNADALGVEVGPRGQHVLERGRLILRGEDAHLAVDRFAPVVAPRCGRAAVVEAHHHVALLGEHPVPELAGSAPLVFHRLPSRFAVNMHDERVFFCTVELRRQHAPAVNFNAVSHRNPEELRGGNLQGGQLLADLLVVGQHPNRLVVGQGNELGLGRHGEGRHRVEGPPAIG